MSHHHTNPFPAALLAATVALAPAMASARSNLDEQVEAMHVEITSLRVIHGLELTDEQVDELIPLVEEGIGLVDDLKAVHADNQQASLVVLGAVRDDLQARGEISEGTEDAVKDHGAECEAAMRPVIEELKMLAEEVMAVLDEEQQARVHEALGKAPWEKRAERKARRSGEEASPRGETLSSETRGELRRHNARKLFGLVFSEEFLAVLQQH